MASEWPLVRLGDYVDSCLGKMLDAKKNKGKPQPYLGNSNVRWGQFDLSDVAQMKFEEHEEERYALRAGDLIVCEGGEPGRCAIWRDQVPGMKIQKALHRVRAKNGLNNEYLYYWLSFAGHAGLLEPHFTGTTIKHLTGRALAEIAVPLPPPSTQDSIVSLLGSIDSRIDNLRQTNATLEAIAQALFKSWFVDFDPVRAKAEGREPEGMDAATAALFPSEFEDSKLGLIPKGWRAGSLTELSELNASKWTARSHPETIQYVDLSCVTSNKMEAVAEYPFEEAPSRARHHLRDGDTIVGTVRPGNCAFAYIHAPEPNLTGSTGFAVLSPKLPHAASFIYLAATRDDSINRLANLADGGAYPAVRPNVVADTPSVIPPEDVLLAFTAMTKPMLERISENSLFAATLASLRDILLPRLISGKLRLPEVALEVAAVA